MEMFNNYSSVIPSHEEKRLIRKNYNGFAWALILNEIIMYTIIFSAYIFFGGLFTEDSEDGIRILTANDLLLSCLAPVAAELITFTLYYAVKRFKVSSIFGTSGFNGRFIFRAIGATLLLHSIFCFIQLLMANGFDILGLYVDGVDYELDGKTSTVIADVITSIIAAPIAEELLYRGVVLRATSKVSARFGIIVSALLFGVMHENPYQFIMCTAVGLVFGYITVKSGSVIPSMICHATMNALVSIIEIIGTANPDYYDMIFFILLGAEFIFGLIVVAITAIKSGIKLPEYTEYHRRRSWRIILTSVPFILIMAYHIYECISCIKPIEETAGKFDEISENAVPAIKILLTRFIGG